VIGRWLATAAIGALLLVAVALPGLPGMGQGVEPGAVRADVADAVGRVGERLPDFELLDLEGEPVRLSDLRGHRVLLTFERSLDW
jgi:cytochrome oxidase Cu insertion factor (SCO1/SenC/PrrC family)